MGNMFISNYNLTFGAKLTGQILSDPATPLYSLTVVVFVCLILMLIYSES